MKESETCIFFFLHVVLFIQLHCFDVSVRVVEISQKHNGNRRHSAWAMCLSRNDPVTQDNLLSFLRAVSFSFCQTTPASCINAQKELIHPVLLSWAVTSASSVVTRPAVVVQDHESTLNLNKLLFSGNSYNKSAVLPASSSSCSPALCVFVCFLWFRSLVEEEEERLCSLWTEAGESDWLAESVSGCPPPTHTHIWIRKQTKEKQEKHLNLHRDEALGNRRSNSSRCKLIMTDERRLEA